LHAVVNKCKIAIKYFGIKYDFSNSEDRCIWIVNFRVEFAAYLHCFNAFLRALVSNIDLFFSCAQHATFLQEQ